MPPSNTKERKRRRARLEGFHWPLPPWPRRRRKGTEANRVTLMTLHAKQGAEFLWSARGPGAGSLPAVNRSLEDPSAWRGSGGCRSANVGIYPAPRQERLFLSPRQRKAAFRGGMREPAGCRSVFSSREERCRRELDHRATSPPERGGGRVHNYPEPGSSGWDRISLG